MKLLSFFTLFLSIIFLSSCSNDENSLSSSKNSKISKHKKSLIEFNSKVINRADKSDLNIILEKKQIRILVSNFTENHSHLPREKLPIDYGANLVIQYAKQLGIEPVVVYAKKHLLSKALLKGYGDIIASPVIANAEAQKKLSTSHAIRFNQQQLIQAKVVQGSKTPSKQPDKRLSPLYKHLNFEQIKNKPDIIDQYFFQQVKNHKLRIGVQKAEVYWDTVKKLQTDHKDIELVSVDNKKTPDEVLDSMIAGSFDATVSDSQAIEIALQYREDIEIAHTLENKEATRWAVRKENPLLLKSINQFIEKHRLSNNIPSVFKGDFKEQKKKGQIRLITRNNTSSYFLWKNKLMGFEYELIKQFAKDHKLSLKVLVAKNFAQMMQWLSEGRGDIVSASLNKTPELEGLPIALTMPYNRTEKVLVQREKEEEITSLEQLNHREVAVQTSSAPWDIIDSIKQQGINLNVKQVPESIETQTILNGVSVAQYDLSIVDRHILDIENAWRDDIKGTLVLDENITHHWLVREKNQQLLKTLNRYIKKHHKSTFYNITYNKYFKNSRQLFNKKIYQQGNGTALSPYDVLIKKYSKLYNFNWLLITAQINQESSFDPKAKSLAGAKGLMQMMPRTAKKLQVSNLEIPKNSISAGVKYMDWIRKQYQENMSVENQIWFTLAAYNAGVGHVQDARKLAKKLKLDPNQWFDNTEKAMLLLSKRKYADKARYGYVRGSEPVFYVKQIRHIYQLYQRAADRKKLASSEVTSKVN